VLVSTFAAVFCAGIPELLVINVVVLANFVVSRSCAVALAVVLEEAAVEVFSENWCSS